MDTKSIRYFCRVYEEKSINKAAKELFISPQGLSKIIFQLENELGVILFERTAKGMIPTESGSYFYKHSKNILYNLEELEYGISRINDRERKLFIGFSCGVLNIFCFKTFERLSRKFNCFNIEWEEDSNNSIIEKINRGELDIALIIGNQVDDDIIKKELFSTEPQLIVYKEHPFYDLKKITLKELKNEPLITLNEKFNSYHNIIQRCRDYGFSPNIVAKTMEAQLIYRFVKEKHGLGIDVNIHNDNIILKDIKQIPLIDAFSWNINIIYKMQKKEFYPIEDICSFFKDNVNV